MRSYLLSHILSAAAEKAPNEPAFKHGAETVSFQELWSRASQLARVLQDLGARRGDRVGACLGRSMESAVALYGITLLGCVYVPLDPRSPKTRILAVAQSCDISILLVNEAQGKSLFADDQFGNIKHLIGCNPARTGRNAMTWQQVAQYPELPQIPNVLEDDLAYILHTSGTTGVPKGIMHTHHSAMSFATLAADLYDLQPTDVFGLHSPPYFDASLMGYLGVPYSLGCAVIVPEMHVNMPGSLAKLINDESISVWYSVPYPFLQLLECDAFETYGYERLRWMLYAGEPFPPRLLKTVMELLPHARFSNIYGPTETNQCTYYHLPAPPDGDVPIGYVWGNTEYKVVDEDDRDVLSGDEGELLIRSATTMKGYWQRPDLDEKAFYVEEPAPGLVKKYYRTGDRVYVDAEGRIVYQGRKDRQVKIRGNRVELLEVEHSIHQLPEVKEVACLALPMDENEKKLIAYVSLESELDLDQQEIKRQLSLNLLPYAVPEEIYILRQLPRSPTGKVDYQRLKDSLSVT